MQILPVLLLLTSGFAAIASAENVVCYFASWTVYRNGKGLFDAPNVDPSLCTHILYGFVGLGSDNTVAILDAWEALDDGLKGFSNLLALKSQNPDLKVLVSMGGWNEGSGKYSKLAASEASRKSFAQNVLKFIQQYKFDGFDLDWEYPGQRDSTNKDDPDNFVLLLKELRSVLSPHGYLLTAAVAGAAKSIDTSYKVPEVSDLLDIINVMAYDFHGDFDPYVGHYAPLHASHLDATEEQQALNVAAGIDHWLNKGADPNKIHLGLGVYGRGFTLASASNTSLYAPISGPSRVGKYTQQSGILGYNEICEFYSDWTYVWDEEQRVPHRYSATDKQWVGYDDEKSLELKVKFAKTRKLGGVMVWSLDTDDFLGTCGEKFPLLKAINKALK